MFINIYQYLSCIINASIENCDFGASGLPISSMCWAPTWHPPARKRPLSSDSKKWGLSGWLCVGTFLVASGGFMQFIV